MFVVLGASGRTGGAAARALVGTGSDVCAHGNTRKPELAGVEKDRYSYVQGPLSSIEASAFDKAVAVLICVGKQNPSRGGKKSLDQQEQLEVTETVRVAEIARAAGVNICVLLSAYGAKEGGARYSATKAKAEAALASVGFARLVVAQPMFILGGGRGPGRCVGSLLKCLGVAIECEQLGIAMAALAREQVHHLQTVPTALEQQHVQVVKHEELVAQWRDVQERRRQL